MDGEREAAGGDASTSGPNDATAEAEGTTASAADVDVNRVVLRFGQSLLMLVAAFVAAAALLPWAERIGLALGAAPESPELAAIRGAGQFVGFALAAIVFLTYAGDRDLVTARIPGGRNAGLGLLTAAGMVLAQFALLLALGAVGVEVATNRALTPGQEAPRYFLYMVPVSILVVGPAEELVFRGVVQGELRKALPAAPAIGLAAFLFGSIHFTAGTGTLAGQAAYVLVATLLAIPLGYLYERTRNLVLPALAHGLYNAALYAIQYADATGLV
ncbi:CPBP family intramembrane metalloprotease [Halorarum halophilum]|uniref:CPBP family intramembrane metalloprotease n=1 Tax=Halorarum halophilum TaxID=2743090 RepID=A0A7D5GLC9_9EURY|nr:CPBP family intramembrane glutamic endopeptidase [Halobaculum halophilum]QLG27924.1 CPBP family intramembrane metalloprotease [Halobaculum halophilum]